MITITVGLLLGVILGVGIFVRRRMGYYYSD
jgi:hypothetical protein